MIDRPGFGFGTPGGPDPSAAGKKGGAALKNAYSIRAEMRKLVQEGYSFDDLTPEGVMKVVAELAKKGELKRAIAIRGMYHVLFGQTDSFDRILDNVEGKLATTNVNASTDLDKEADARTAAEIKKHLLQGFVPDEGPQGPEPIPGEPNT